MSFYTVRIYHLKVRSTNGEGIENKLVEQHGKEEKVGIKGTENSFIYLIHKNNTRCIVPMIPNRGWMNKYSMLKQ